MQRNFEPSYGHYLTSGLREGVITKSFQCESLKDLERVVKGVEARRGLECEYLAKVLDVRVVPEGARVEVDFEYFGVTFGARKESLRSSAPLFLDFASQLLFFWHFLRGRGLFATDFSASALRFDEQSGELKFIGMLQEHVEGVEDLWSVPGDKARAFFRASAKGPESKRGLSAFLCGLIFLSIFSNEAEFRELKAAVCSIDLPAFQKQIQRFRKLEEVNRVEGLTGRQLFESTVFDPQNCLFSPGSLLKDLKVNIALFSFSQPALPGLLPQASPAVPDSHPEKDDFGVQPDLLVESCEPITHEASQESSALHEPGLLNHLSPLEALSVGLVFAQTDAPSPYGLPRKTYPSAEKQPRSQRELSGSKSFQLENFSFRNNKNEFEASRFSDQNFPKNENSLAELLPKFESPLKSGSKPHLIRKFSDRTHNFLISMNLSKEEHSSPRVFEGKLDSQAPSEEDYVSPRGTLVFDGSFKFQL